MSVEQWQRSRPKWSPRPEQVRGMELILKGKGARLFLHPGKGKTSVVLKSFQMLKQKGLVDKLLVIAPLRVVTTSWPAQIEHWDDFKDLTYTVIHGDRQGAMDKDVDVYLMNFEGLLTKEWKVSGSSKPIVPPKTLKWLRANRFMLAVDESTKMKNPSSQRFKLIKTILKEFIYNTIMTGTPKPKNLEDLFSQCYLTDGGRDLGQYITHYRCEFMYPAANGFGFEPQPGADKRVAEKIAGTTLQLEYEEAVPSQIIPIWVPMPEDIKPKYEELRKEFLTTLGNDTVLAPTSAAVLVKLRQFAQGALYHDGETIELHGAKLDALENLLEELNGEPLFCLTAFRHDVKRIRDRLAQPALPNIGSGTSAALGAAACASFSAGNMPLLLGHPASVAHGVDGLQNNCHNVLWFEQTWSWEEFYQANLRVVRSGTKAEQVFIYQLMMDCGVERAMLASVQDKRGSEDNFCSLLRELL